MAVIAPNTEIYLIKSPIELDNDNQLDFTSATAQYNYFASLPKVTLANATFQRKDGYIRWPASMENIIEYNYCMYRNKNHGNKWFYAFITDIQYATDNSCNVYIKTDVWQTWQFDITYKESFIEREHVNDDTFGLHTIPENLDTGNYVCNDSPIYYQYAKANDADLAPVILFQVTKTTVGNIVFPSSSRQIYNGIPQGCSCFGVRLLGDTTTFIPFVCGAYDSQGIGDAIVSISLVPYVATQWDIKHYTQGGVEDPLDILVPKDTWGSYDRFMDDPIARNTTLDGYTPKNNKLFTKEFNYLYVTNNVGGDITFYYEDFDGDPQFIVSGALEQGGSMKLWPYNSIVSSQGASNYDCWSEGLQGAKLPNISWASDYYLNWQAVNGKNVAIQTGIEALQWGGGVLNMMGGNGGGPGVLSFASSIANSMQQVRAAKMVPPQAKGNYTTGDINFSHGSAEFVFRQMSVRAEYAKIIDDYFTMYGYKVNTLKLPNVTGRPYWNYVKTQGCNITGDIPQSDIEEIKGLFNRGITIWHNATYFLDYSQDNTIA